MWHLDREKHLAKNLFGVVDHTHTLYVHIHNIILVNLYQNSFVRICCCNLTTSITMPSRSFALLWVLSIMSVLGAVTGFAPMVPVALEVTVSSSPVLTTTTTTTTTAFTSNLQQGIQNYLESPMESSTMALSLKDRPPPPTKEEIAAKQRNFNFWFWGGGFVAPFIATVYYFGPKFWTK